MTSSSASPADPADFAVNRPGALIAGLPAVLGFVPEHSLVLALIERGRLGAVMRVDLFEGLADDVAQLAAAAAGSRPEGVVAVIVDDGSACGQCLEGHRLLAAALADELEAHGIALWDVHVVDRVGVGGRWQCLFGCGGGQVDDPMASPMAVAAVLDGRRLYGRRDELQAVIATADEHRSAGLVPAARAAERRRARARGADPQRSARTDAQAVIAAADRVVGGSELSEGELAELAAALADETVRDVLYALAAGEGADQAEALWGELARTLPGPWRAHALTLLAFFAYVRGDGPLAGISLEAALSCQPAHRMAGMLDRALQTGMHPLQIHELALTGYQVAARIGVSLPTRRARRTGAP